jgi:hypothetical protein
VREKVAVTHAPEGAGNAIRMMAIASELEDEYDVVMAGGGPGTFFLEMNGFDEFEPASIDFIDDSNSHNQVVALFLNLFNFFQRFTDFFSWIRKEDPDLMVTDDPLAAVAAKINRIDFFRVDHAKASFFDSKMQYVGFKIFNYYSINFGEGFFYTCLWPDSESVPDKVHSVGPIVFTLDQEFEVDQFDKLVIPGTYSEGFEELAKSLREDYEVKLVGGENWETVPAMLPIASEADSVLCTGFSSIAEAAVAGTTCVVYPFIDCQKGVADKIEEHDIKGIEVVHSLDEAKKKMREAEEKPEVGNGVREIAKVIDRYFSMEEPEDSSKEKQKIKAVKTTKNTLYVFSAVFSNLYKKLTP